MAVPIQKAREVVFQMLYSLDMGYANEENMLELLSNELAITKKTIREIQARVRLIQSHLKEIDKLISSTSKSYEFERIQSVERNILRLGVFELLHDPTIPPKVAIAEATRLARKFSTKESALFVHAILDAIHKSKCGDHVDAVKITQTAAELSKSEEIAREASLKKHETTG